jgi:carotenoid 1,2-hydratase
LNVALYGKPGSRWAMTERSRSAVSRTPNSFRLGPSSLHWNGETLEIEINEICAPIPKRLRGRVRLTPGALPRRMFHLDPEMHHAWQPIAPRSRIDVQLSHPDLSWSGDAYLDSNNGDEPLENAFIDWTWSRSHHHDGAAMLYDARLRNGGAMSLALKMSSDGALASSEPPPLAALATTAWRIGRSTRSDAGTRPTISRTLEDTPFYSRSVISSSLFGEKALSFHESLSLDRFRSPIVKAMLPFRMPRSFR